MARKLKDANIDIRHPARAFDEQALFVVFPAAQQGKCVPSINLCPKTIAVSLFFRTFGPQNLKPYHHATRYIIIDSFCVDIDAGHISVPAQR